MERSLEQTVPVIECKETQQLYLMVDAGQINDLALQVYRLPGELELEFIYLKPPYAHLMGVSPCIIKVTDPVRDWFLAQNQPTAGYFFATDRLLEPLAEGFRALIRVETPYGGSVFLKMAHSEVADVLLATQAPALWQLIEIAWLPTRCGWRVYRRLEGQGCSSSGQLKLTDEQWQRFGDISWRNQLEKLERHMSRYFPERLPETPHVWNWLEHHAELAYSQGFTQERELLTYFNIIGWLGEDACKGDYPDIKALIETRSSSTPSQRLEQAAKLAEKYANTHKEVQL